MPQAFVIMQIGHPELDALCETSIFPAIRACGLDPRRVDRHNEGGLLKSEIVRFIQESDILIADLTNERPNVYLEVGYAMGLDKFRSLIPTVREDHFSDSPNYVLGGPKIHFDLAGYDVLRWSAADLDRFRAELEQRIRRRQAILAPGQPVTPAVVWDPTWIASQRATALEGLAALGRQGHMEVRAALQPPKPSKTQVELNQAARNAQIETFGWPIAVYLDVEGSRPRPRADGIAASIATGSKDSFDYWAIRTNGDFYFLGSLFEDERRREQAGQFLYFDTRINRVTEALLYCIRLYSGLGVDRSARVSIGIRHGGLRGRFWDAASPRRFVRKGRTTEEDSIDVETVGTLDEIEGQLVDRVIELTAPLFRVFDFAEVDRTIYEAIVNSFVAGQIA